MASASIHGSDEADDGVNNKNSSPVSSAGEVPEPRLCESCKRDEIHVEAHIYCLDCGELLCPDCAKYHKRNKFTAEHYLCEIQDGLYDVAKLDYLNKIMKCQEHPREDINHICAQDEELCCSECVITNHRRCNRFVSIAGEEAEKSCMSLEDAQQNLEMFKKHAVTLTQHERRQISIVKESEREMKSKLVDLKDDINRMFATAEQDIEEKSAKARLEITGHCEIQMERLTKLQSSLERIEDKLAAASKFGQKKHLYLVRRELQTEIKEHKRVLKENHSTATKKTVSITGDDKFRQELDRTIQRLLTVTKTNTNADLPRCPDVEGERYVLVKPVNIL